MIHVVFNHSDIAVLKKAMELDPALSGEVLQIEDDFAVGPLGEIFTEEGNRQRKDWWRIVLKDGDYDGRVDEVQPDGDKVKELILNLGEEPAREVWIWAAQNAHDVCGYYWLMSQLQEFQGRVYILYLNNLPFISEKGQLFYPEWLHQIPPKEFLKAKKLARPITLSEFEIDPDEWKKICQDNGGIRVLEGGKKISSRDFDYFDDDLKKGITGDWQKASKVIHQFLHRHPHTTGDAYLLWRLKTILATGEFDVQGNLRGMKDFEIKNRSLLTTPAVNE